MEDKEQVHIEYTPEEKLIVLNINDKAFNEDSVAAPKGYLYSPYFLGSMAVVGMSLLGSIGGFALVAPILGVIDADIGPNKNIVWVR